MQFWSRHRELNTVGEVGQVGRVVGVAGGLGGGGTNEGNEHAENWRRRHRTDTLEKNWRLCWHLRERCWGERCGRYTDGALSISMGYSVLKISKGRKVGAGFSMSACGDARGMGGLRPSDAWGALSAPGLPQQNTKKYILNGGGTNVTSLFCWHVMSGQGLKYLKKIARYKLVPKIKWKLRFSWILHKLLKWRSRKICYQLSNKTNPNLPIRSNRRIL